MRLALLVFLLPLFSYSTPAPRVLMMTSTGFYAPEYYEPREIFENYGFQIDVAAKYPSAVYPDQRQVDKYPPVKPNLTFSDVDVSNYHAIVFAGGNGAWEDFFPNSDVHKIVTEALSTNKITALICSATGLLGVANNLDGEGTPIAQGRNVTGYKRVVGLLKVLGKVRYQKGPSEEPFVVVDGNLITGRDPKSSQLFGKTVAERILKR